jgi:hypothetical protein
MKDICLLKIWCHNFYTNHLVHTVKAKSVTSPIRKTTCYDCVLESHEVILCVSLGLHKPWKPWCWSCRWTVEHWCNFAWPSLLGCLFATASVGFGVPRNSTGLLCCIYILCDNFSWVDNRIWSRMLVWRSYGWCLWFRLVVLGDGRQHVCVERYMDSVWRVSSLLLSLSDWNVWWTEHWFLRMRKPNHQIEMVAVRWAKEREHRYGSACCNTNWALVNKIGII